MRCAPPRPGACSRRACRRAPIRPSSSRPRSSCARPRIRATCPWSTPPSGDLERPLRAAVDPSSLQAMTLTPSEGYLLSRLDGASSARGVLELLPLEPEAARRCLFGLVAGGLVVFEDPPSAPPKAIPAPTPTPGDLRGRLQDAAAEWARDERRRAILDAHARLAGERDHFVVLGLSPRGHRGGGEDGLLRPGPTVSPRHAGRTHRSSRHDPGGLCPPGCGLRRAGSGQEPRGLRGRAGAVAAGVWRDEHVHPGRGHARGARRSRHRERPCLGCPSPARARKTWTWPGGRRKA